MSERSAPPPDDPWSAPPGPRRGATAGARAREASPQTQARLGYPEQLVDDWQARAVASLGERVRERRSLAIWMDACIKCGACTDKCHFYRGTGDAKNMPVARQDLIRSVYRRYHTRLGRWFPWLVGAKPLDEAMLEDWYTYFHQCTQCRRCAVYCPVGIDTAEFAKTGRAILNEIGRGQQFTNDIVDKATRLGNNLGLPVPALEDTLAGLEEELLEQTGHPIPLPLDAPGAQLLLVVPSADFFAEPHVDGLLGIAKIFYQVGLRWTLSSQASEAANFAAFTGDVAKMRALGSTVGRAAEALGVEHVVVGECGHAWRVADALLDGWRLGNDRSPGRRTRARHVVEITLELIESGRLRLDRSRNDERVVTYHDSCNVVRGATLGGRVGGQLSVPRAVLRAACRHFVEMRADASGQRTWCCGGGAGLLGDDVLGLRVKGALPRMQAFREVAQERQVTHIAAMCAICKAQLSAVFPAYGYDRSQVVSVHQLVGDAVVFEGE